MARRGMFADSTILIVDDNDDDIVLTRRAMQKACIMNPVEVVRDGLEAKEFLMRCSSRITSARHAYPLLMLLDLEMPRLGGVELLAWMRKDPKLKRLWVIMLSHSQEPADVNRAYEAGANSYIVKPTRLSSLVEIFEVIREYWLQMCEPPEVEPQ